MSSCGWENTTMRPTNSTPPPSPRTVAVLALSLGCNGWCGSVGSELSQPEWCRVCGHEPRLPRAALCSYVAASHIEYTSLQHATCLLCGRGLLWFTPSSAAAPDLTKHICLR